MIEYAFSKKIKNMAANGFWNLQVWILDSMRLYLFDRFLFFLLLQNSFSLYDYCLHSWKWKELSYTRAWNKLIHLLNDEKKKRNFLRNYFTRYMSIDWLFLIFNYYIFEITNFSFYYWSKKENKWHDIKS